MVGQLGACDGATNIIYLLLFYIFKKYQFNEKLLIKKYTCKILSKEQKCLLNVFINNWYYIFKENLEGII